MDEQAAPEECIVDCLQTGYPNDARPSGQMDNICYTNKHIINYLKSGVIIWLYFECSAQYSGNLPFLVSDIRALWRSGLSARVPKCQKLKCRLDLDCIEHFQM